MHEIIPAILPKDVADLEKKLQDLPGEITFFHMDVLEEDIWTDKNFRDFEAHLLVKEPERIAHKWIERGAKRIIVHRIDHALAQCRDKAEVGIAVDIDKPLKEFEPFFEFIDFVHLMSIDELGTQGDDFEPKVFAKINELKERYPEIPISIDGGISLNNYETVLKAGVKRIVVGYHFKEVWNSLKKS